MLFFNRSHLFHHHHHLSSPERDMEMSDFQHHTRHSGKSCSASSSSSSGYDYDDSIDAITPCPLLETIASNQTQNSHPRDLHLQTQSKKFGAGGLSRNSSQKRPASRCESWRSTQPRPFQGYVGDNNEDDEELDTEILWKQMLAVQDRFGCYNSARMRAALEGGDNSIPSRICLDLINDSIGEMPEDVRQRIELFLEREGSGAMMRKGKWRRFWHRVIYV
ncbi:hypothetical protein QBC40DRAFT_288958 [Triangularia verruculosa]|uniref:Uncharacterized protein n=1 Tax=Triangularia verruculosa TaxID=2587418 RepID=A0AAN6X9L6_9PEZI|nr:hypothetical protein QBC40DRAFT_288958 [Triangularia verruculosa]